MEKYLDTMLSPEERAADLLSKMDLDEKFGQINCVFPFEFRWEETKETIKRHHGIGQISTLDMRRCSTLEEAAAWQRELQETAMEASEHHIPAVFHMEGLNGAFIQEAVSFPGGLARSCSFDTELEEKLAHVVAQEELSCGITQTLAPVLDISRDSRMGRQGETYGEDPALASAMGVAYIRGLQNTTVQGRKTESVAKHFLGFHNSAAGIHGAHSDTPERLMREIYGRSFQAAISKAELRGIMPCYCLFDGEPASASGKMLTKLLREEMGFDGVCLSDYCAVSNVHKVQHVGESFAEAGLLCMEAGMDIETPECMSYNDELKSWFADGRADMAVLDRAVERILTAKFRMGIFEHPYAFSGDELKAQFHTKEEQEVSRKAAEESMVLLKNDHVLPIDQTPRRILVVGPQSKNPRFYFGGYTHHCMVESSHAAADSMAGVDDGRPKADDAAVRRYPGSQVQCDESEIFDQVLEQIKPGCRSLYDALCETFPNADFTYAYGYPQAGNDFSGHDEVLEKAESADLIILTLGGKYSTGSIATTGEGVDATNIGLPECQEELIRKLGECKVPMIGIHFDGRPISSDIADRCLNAILEVWTPGEYAAEAIARILSGAYNPSGKLTVSVARNAGQIPIYYNHPYGSHWHQGESIGFVNYVDCPHTPRYCFGYGLSYTKFHYCGFFMEHKVLKPGDRLKVSVDIENIGAVSGTEIVQMYITDEYASVARPVKELVGFSRVILQPGEKKTIRFETDLSQLAFLDRDMKWKIEKGSCRIELGSSSEDIQLSDTFKISEDAWIDGKKREFYTIGEQKEAIKI